MRKQVKKMMASGTDIFSPFFHRFMFHTAGSIEESNNFFCCGFSCADLRCKFKLHLIEGG